jgi:hypothetical protein
MEIWFLIGVILTSFTESISSNCDKCKSFLYDIAICVCLSCSDSNQTTKNTLCAKFEQFVI